jgi:hypothetical protein
MNRMAELEARRRALLARCETQRIELAERMAQLHQQSRPATLAAWAEGGSGRGPARHPLAWIGVLGGLMLLGRTRDVLKLLVWARTALAVASRTAQVLRAVRDMRRRRGPARPKGAV